MSAVAAVLVPVLICTVRAARHPSAARRSIAARGAPTIANSAATNSPFSRISTRTMSTGPSTVMRRPPRSRCRCAPAPA